MARMNFIAILCLSVFLASCTRIVFDSQTGTTRELRELTRPSDSISNVVGGEGMQADVSFSATRIAFIRQVGGVPQVFVMELGESSSLQQLTSDSAAKSHPRWSLQGRLAFASGSNIVVLNPDFTPFNLGSPALQTDGGLDFFDGGTKLVYARDKNLYVSPLDRSNPEGRITNCSGSVSCGLPVVSHDQSKLAYRQTIMLGAGWATRIIVMSLTGSGGATNIVMGPAVGGGEKIHSFDFSPGDDQMYVSAKPFVSGSGYGSQQVLFVVDLDGSNMQQLSPPAPARYPSTYRTPF